MTYCVHMSYDANVADVLDVGLIVSARSSCLSPSSSSRPQDGAMLRTTAIIRTVDGGFSTQTS